MARPLVKKNDKGVLTRPPGIEKKIDIALTQDWATLSRRTRETNPRSDDLLPSECLVHLIRDAIWRGDDRVARVLMPQLLKRAEANLERTVPDIPVDANTISPIVSRVMSQFENQLYERRQARAVTLPARAATTSVANPFVDLDRQEFRRLVSQLDVSNVFLSKLRDRTIDAMTIPKGYCRHLAEEIDEDFEAMSAHLYAPQESVAAGRQLYKAEGKPKAVPRQTFEQAVTSSGLTEAQQRRLLSFRD
jgi:hypothetical protein